MEQLLTLWVDDLNQKMEQLLTLWVDDLNQKRITLTQHAIGAKARSLFDEIQ
jgi:hypothetical protein